MSVFALQCVSPAHRRSLEAALLSAKLPVARDGDPSITHVLIDSALLHDASRLDYPDAQVMLVDMSRLHELVDQLRGLRPPRTVPAQPELIGISTQIDAVRKTIAMIAASDVTVLITGETGCGKECAVRMIHRLSRRSQMPLVALNCAAIPDTMLEGELFGYEKGAFTGAIKAYPGKIKLSDGGTLALDEIGDLSPQGQAKILRAIETHEFYRIGGVKPERFNARIVAMTNVDLAAASASNGFRKDLYYRLAVAQIHLPPLRERREDILPLARHFLEKSTKEISEDAADALQSYLWPGNVRELNNVMMLAALQSAGHTLNVEALPAQVRQGQVLHRGASQFSERDRLIAALKAAGGNKSVAAKSLNWSRMTLYRKLEIHMIASDPIHVTRRVTV